MTSGTAYTLSGSTTYYLINTGGSGSKVTKLEFEAAVPACTAPTSVGISGAYHYFPGDNISLTATPEGGSGTPTTYQWYKDGTDNANAIDGATSATYTKNDCSFSDAGSYYCKVTKGGTASTFSSGFGVKILRLYVKTGRNGTDYGYVDFTKVDGSTAIATIYLGSNWDYGFNVADGCGHWFGNTGSMSSANCTGWTMDVNGTDCLMRTTNGATYTFTVNYSDLAAPVVSVTYPINDQASGKIIYFDNSVLSWSGSKIYYRIGHITYTQATLMSLVPGTANLYKVTTSEFNGFSGWHISNNCGWTGSNSIYRTYTNNDSYQIPYATVHEGGAVTASAVTLVPTTSRGYGSDADLNDNCTFYNYTLNPGMKTQNVAITAPSNGTITVSYKDISNSSQSFTGGNRDLAHTVILTITATPAPGYELSTLTVNGSDHTSGNTYTVTDKTVIEATFTPSGYVVTYADGGKDGGGDAPTDGTFYSSGADVTVLGNVNSMTKTGKVFRGWTDGTTFFRAGDVFSITSDVTLTAVWDNDDSDNIYFGCITITAGALTKGNTSTTQFFTNSGGTIANSTAVSFTSNPSTAGYYFESNDLSHESLATAGNWNTSSTSNRYLRGFKFSSGTSYTLALGSGVATAITFYGYSGSNDKTLTVGGQEHNVATKNTFFSHEFTKSGNFTGNVTISGDGDFYGIIVISFSSATNFTVRFAHGSVAPASASGMPGNIVGVPSGKRIVEPADPSADHCTFGGWYTDAACTAAWNWGSSTVTKDTVLYAKWTGESYILTYKDQGDVAFSGSHETGYPTTHSYGTPTLLKRATKSGKVFGGWYTASACTGSRVTTLGATDYTSGITLYAKWLDYKQFTKVTDAASLEAEDEVIFVYETGRVVNSTISSNRMAATDLDIEFSSPVGTYVNVGTGAGYIFTLSESSTNWKLTDAENQSLAVSNTNKIEVQEDGDDWSVSITTGNASVVSATTSKSTKTLLYNTADNVFTVYSGTGGDVAAVQLYSYRETSPAIRVTPATAESFSYVTGNGPSPAQEFAVSGRNLTGNLTLSVPSGYEASVTSASSGFGTSDIVLTKDAGDNVNATVWIRLAEGLSQGNHNGDATVSGGGATTVTLSLTGKVVAMPVGTGFVKVTGNGDIHAGETYLFVTETYGRANGQNTKVHGHFLTEEPVMTVAGVLYAEDDNAISPFILKGRRNRHTLYKYSDTDSVLTAWPGKKLFFKDASSVTADTVGQWRIDASDADDAVVAVTSGGYGQVYYNKSDKRFNIYSDPKDFHKPIQLYRNNCTTANLRFLCGGVETEDLNIALTSASRTITAVFATESNGALDFVITPAPVAGDIAFDKSAKTLTVTAEGEWDITLTQAEGDYCPAEAYCHVKVTKVTNKVFAGWTAAAIDAVQATPPADLSGTATPVITDPDLIPVFASQNGGKDAVYFLTDYSTNGNTASSPATVTWLRYEDATLSGTMPSSAATGSTLTMPSLSKDSLFNGWKVTLDGSQKDKIYTGGDSYLVNHNVTFTAQWEPLEETGAVLDIVDWDGSNVIINMNGYVGTGAWSVQSDNTGAWKSLASGANADRTVTLSAGGKAPGEHLLLTAKGGETVDSRHYYKVPFVYNATTTLTAWTGDAESVIYVRNGTLTLDVNVTAAAVWVSPEAHLVIAAGRTLTCDSLMLRTTAWQQAELTDNGTLAAGKLRYTRIVKSKDYNQFALPFSTDLSKVFLSLKPGGRKLTYGNWLVKRYDTQSRADNGILEDGGNWKKMAANARLDSCTGYEFYSNSAYYREFFFPVIYTKTVPSASVKRSINCPTGSVGVTNDGWNFLCSPFTYTYTPSPSPEITIAELAEDNLTYYQTVVTSLPPVRPFYYQAAEAGDMVFGTTLSFEASVPSPVAGRRHAAQGHAALQWCRLVVTDAEEPAVYDETNILLSDSYTDDYELGRDVTKLLVEAGRPQFYSVLPCGSLATAALPSATATVPLGLFVPGEGTYVISSVPNDWQNQLEHLWLVDADLGVVADLLTDTWQYVSDGRASTFRFSIMPVLKQPGTATSSSALSSTSASFSTSADGIIVSGLKKGSVVRVFDAAGRLLRQTTAEDSVVHISLGAAGVYTVCADDKAQKIIIR